MSWERERSAERREAKSSLSLWGCWVFKMRKIWSRRELLRRLNQSLNEETRRSESRVGVGAVQGEGRTGILLWLLLLLLVDDDDEIKEEEEEE